MSLRVLHCCLFGGLCVILDVQLPLAMVVRDYPSGFTAALGSGSASLQVTHWSCCIVLAV